MITNNNEDAVGNVLHDNGMENFETRRETKDVVGVDVEPDRGDHAMSAASKYSGCFSSRITVIGRTPENYHKYPGDIMMPIKTYVGKDLVPDSETLKYAVETGVNLFVVHNTDDYREHRIYLNHPVFTPRFHDLLQKVTREFAYVTKESTNYNSYKYKPFDDIDAYVRIHSYEDRDNPNMFSTAVVIPEALARLGLVYDSRWTKQGYTKTKHHLKDVNPQRNAELESVLNTCIMLHQDSEQLATKGLITYYRSTETKVPLSSWLSYRGEKRTFLQQRVRLFLNSNKVSAIKDSKHRYRYTMAQLNE